MGEINTCRYCGEEKDITAFVKSKQSKTGYRVICKPCLNAQKKIYLDANREQHRQYMRTYRKTWGKSIHLNIDSRIREIVSSARKRRPFDFSIDCQHVKSLWENQNGLCVYTKLPLTLEANQFNTISIDRINSSIGYTKDNTQLVCRAVNEMKMHREESLFIHLCHVVALNNQDKYTLST